MVVEPDSSESRSRSSLTNWWYLFMYTKAMPRVSCRRRSESEIRVMKDADVLGISVYGGGDGGGLCGGGERGLRARRGGAVGWGIDTNDVVVFLDEESWVILAVRSGEDVGAESARQELGLGRLAHGCEYRSLSHTHKPNTASQTMVLELIGCGFNAHGQLQSLMAELEAGEEANDRFPTDISPPRTVAVGHSLLKPLFVGWSDLLRASLRIGQFSFFFFPFFNPKNNQSESNWNVQWKETAGFSAMAPNAAPAPLSVGSPATAAAAAVAREGRRRSVLREATAVLSVLSSPTRARSLYGKPRSSRTRRSHGSSTHRSSGLGFPTYPSQATTGPAL